MIVSGKVEALIRGLPKAELHVHLEGTLEPELMFDLARRNHIDLPFPSIDAAREAYRFNNLQEFLDLYYQGMAVLRTEEDFFDLTYAYLKRAHDDGVRHVEMFFDPQGHTERDVSFGEVIRGITRARVTAESSLSMSTKLIMCFLRHLPESDAFATYSEAEPWLEEIVGIGLDSSELGHPPSKFARVFQLAREDGLKTVAHAGEEGPPEYVREAVEILGVDRIDHGNRALEDPDLVRRLVDDATTLTVCPLSNLRLCVVDDMRSHPIRKMLELDLKVTVNSDDPAYFGGYVNDNFMAVHDALTLTPEECMVLARNSFEGAFLDADSRAAYLDEIRRYAEQQA
ncbi:MAG: adenosine deaminase [Sphingomonadales bacterium]|nr:adenosine deaminase [Sphingomonadales bacterium]